jgi:hypothetical protein
MSQLGTCKTGQYVNQDLTKTYHLKRPRRHAAHSMPAGQPQLAAIALSLISATFLRTAPCAQAAWAPVEQGVPMWQSQLLL